MANKTILALQTVIDAAKDPDFTAADVPENACVKILTNAGYFVGDVSVDHVAEKNALALLLYSADAVTVDAFNPDAANEYKQSLENRPIILTDAIFVPYATPGVEHKMQAVQLFKSQILGLTIASKND